MNETLRFTAEFRRVSITELRNHTIRNIDEIVKTDMPVTITYYGKSVATLPPLGYFGRQFIHLLAASLTGHAATCDE